VGAVAQRIGHRFGDPKLLRECLTHSSAAAARGRTHRRNNERLEFLGDRVLGLVVADLLFTAYPGEGEGDLSRRHAALVRRETLAEVAAEIDLGEWLVLSRSEEDGGGRTNPTILADAMEALIGAVHRDAGLEASSALIRRFWQPRLAAMDAPPQDVKTALQEWSQERSLGLPRYEVVQTAGPDHAPTFEVMVTLADLPPEQARGNSKRMAERAAAERLLTRVMATPETDGDGRG
jgi:ribonuclease-3